MPACHLYSLLLIKPDPNGVLFLKTVFLTETFYSRKENVCLCLEGVVETEGYGFFLHRHSGAASDTGQKCFFPVINPDSSVSVPQSNYCRFHDTMQCSVGVFTNIRVINIGI
jgi:hypothetical protein